VQPTELGKRFLIGDREQYLSFPPPSRRRVLDIARNDLVNHGADQLRLIVGTAIWEVHPAVVETLRAKGYENSPERRFAILLKFDPVLKNWSICAEDDGPRAGTLQTDTVNAYLKK
jgi:hypothetical protein